MSHVAARMVAMPPALRQQSSPLAHTAQFTANWETSWPQGQHKPLRVLNSVHTSRWKEGNL